NPWIPRQYRIRRIAFGSKEGSLSLGRTTETRLLVTVVPIGAPAMDSPARSPPRPQGRMIGLSSGYGRHGRTYWGTSDPDGPGCRTGSRRRRNLALEDVCVLGGVAEPRRVMDAYAIAGQGGTWTGPLGGGHHWEAPKEENLGRVGNDCN
ncbi:hypothetical protein B296_00015495, partial [Ensete ventricosum]